jgi:hypothetical protein
MSGWHTDKENCDEPFFVYISYEKFNEFVILSVKLLSQKGGGVTYNLGNYFISQRRKL